ncbi:hypothetical protein V5O48_007658 [Marasmius crinis-equi]|uniref:Serine-threonine/tyrosine-protein kinase catalytic domain-containing protein n=1 Tax=Marasmius crinis-equi TaxID=585013 RepID=A0ABR3FG67_9AGAR
MFAVVIDGQHPTRPGSPSALVDVVWAMMVSCWNAEPSARPNMVDVLARVREFRSDGSPGPADEKKLLPIPSHQAKRYKGTQANLAVSPDRTLTMVAVKPPKSEGAPSRPPVPRDLRLTPSPEPQATLGMPTPGGPSDNPYYVVPPSSYISELPSRYAAGSEPRSSRKRDYSPDNYSPSPPPSKMSKILSLQRPRSVPPADSEEEYEELVGELEPDPRYATPGPDDAPEEIQERISDVVDRLMQLDEQWTTFFAWKNQHHVPGQLKVYEFIKKMADRYVGHRVPFRSVRHHRFEMRHILRALLLNKDPKIGDNCHETLHLLSLYGPEGTRLQDPRIVKEMDNKEQPKNGAKPIKRFLRLLREIDGEWKKARNNSA